MFFLLLLNHKMRWSLSRVRFFLLHLTRVIYYATITFQLRKRMRKCWGRLLEYRNFLYNFTSDYFQRPTSFFFDQLARFSLNNVQIIQFILWKNRSFKPFYSYDITLLILRLIIFAFTGCSPRNSRSFFCQSFRQCNLRQWS